MAAKTVKMLIIDRQPKQKDGSRKQYGYTNGNIYEVSPEEAKRLIEEGVAKPVDEEPERATSKKYADAEKRG